MENEEGAFIRGTCGYCGQVQVVPVSVTQEEADERAADECDCYGAVRERHRLERVERARENIDRVFGSGAADYGQRPVGGNVLDFLCHAHVQGEREGQPERDKGQEPGELKTAATERAVTAGCGGIWVWDTPIIPPSYQKIKTI